MRIFLQETFAIEDCVKYIQSQSFTYGTSVSSNVIQELSTSTDYSIEGTVTAPVNHHINFATTSNQDNNQDGVGGIYHNGSNKYCYFASNTGGTQVINGYNSPYSFKFVRESTTMKSYINDDLINTETASIVSSYKYLRATSWSTSKTVTVTDLKIKPL